MKFGSCKWYFVIIVVGGYALCIMISQHARIQNQEESCLFSYAFLGRTEKSFEKFHVSPDGKHLVFLGNNGYIILVSSKVKCRVFLPRREYRQALCNYLQ